jgi:hypothetical protein
MNTFLSAGSPGTSLVTPKTIATRRNITCPTVRKLCTILSALKYCAEVICCIGIGKFFKGTFSNIGGKPERPNDNCALNFEH